ncbi:hypothetical protein Vafri_2484, partial [Volvox africanus]
ETHSAGSASAVYSVAIPSNRSSHPSQGDIPPAPPQYAQPLPTSPSPKPALLHYLEDVTTNKPSTVTTCTYTLKLPFPSLPLFPVPHQYKVSSIRLPLPPCPECQHQDSCYSSFPTSSSPSFSSRTPSSRTPSSSPSITSSPSSISSFISSSPSSISSSPSSITSSSPVMPSPPSTSHSGSGSSNSTAQPSGPSAISSSVIKHSSSIPRSPASSICM